MRARRDLTRGFREPRGHGVVIPIWVDASGDRWLADRWPADGGEWCGRDGSPCGGRGGSRGREETDPGPDRRDPAAREGALQPTDQAGVPGDDPARAQAARAAAAGDRRRLTRGAQSRAHPGEPPSGRRALRRRAGDLRKEAEDRRGGDRARLARDVAGPRIHHRRRLGPKPLRRAAADRRANAGDYQKARRRPEPGLCEPALAARHHLQLSQRVLLGAALLRGEPGRAGGDSSEQGQHHPPRGGADARLLLLDDQPTAEGDHLLRPSDRHQPDSEGVERARPGEHPVGHRLDVPLRKPR